MGALFMAIGSDPVPSMRDLRAEIPEELEAAVRKCLVKDVTSRTQSIAELAEALAPFGDEDSHISVERISRVLSTPGSLPRGKISGRISKLPQGSGAVAAVTAPAATSPSVTSTPAPVVGAALVLKSGSMAALALSEGGAPAVAPPRKRGGAIAVGVIVLAGAPGGAAVFGMRDRKTGVTAEPVPSSVVVGAAATSAPGAAAPPSGALARAAVDPAAPAAAAADPMAVDPRGGAAAPGLGLRPGLKKGATTVGSASAPAPAPASASAAPPPATEAPVVATAAPSASAAAAPAAPAEAVLPEAYQDLPEYTPPPAGANPLAASAAPAAGSPKPIKKGKLPPRKP